MLIIKDLFQNYRIAEPVKKSGRRSERGDLIVEFTEKINSERGERKHFTVSSMAYMLSIYKTGDLYDLLKKCNSAKSFTACFWYFVKPKLSTP